VDGRIARYGPLTRPFRPKRSEVIRIGFRGTGQLQKSFQWRHQRMTLDAANALCDLGQAQESSQLRDGLLTTIAADWGCAFGQDQFGPCSRHRGSSAQAAVDRGRSQAQANGEAGHDPTSMSAFASPGHMNGRRLAFSSQVNPCIFPMRRTDLHRIA
jgi:hypothetical protein